jgi:general secretion pathway protein I
MKKNNPIAPAMKQGALAPVFFPAGSRGFTLMEVMIAMAILAIALVAIFQSQSQSVSMAAHARFLTTSSLLAQSKMAEIEAKGLRNTQSENGDFGDGFTDYRWRLDVRDTEIDRVKKLEMTVTHARLARNNTYTVVLYKLMARP